MRVANTESALRFPWENSFARELQGLYAPMTPSPVAQPAMIKLNRALAAELGLNAVALDSEAGAAIFSGNTTPDGAATLAQAYAGHQFGHFVPQLGDGRALLLGEVVDREGCRRDIQLKGSGRTPFSRGGDGRAALGPVLREYLLGEAMHALGVPTTRALAAVTTGESVYRERPLPGAVLTRVAASHIRVGTFQYFAVREEWDKLRRLADYSIQRHYPSLRAETNPYLGLLANVADRQAALIAQWMHVGFIHGVMNTDNMAISGETIDYGPCAFMDRYDPESVFSSIDRQGRYRYANQPTIAQWNLARLAEALLPLIAADPHQAVVLASEVIDGFAALYERYWLAGMRKKLGLLASEEDDDRALALDLLGAMAARALDWNLTFRGLAEAAAGDEERAPDVGDWYERWQQRLSRETIDAQERASAMRQANPAFIPRNHRVEEALSAAVERHDYAPFETLLGIFERPFDDQPEFADFMEPALAAAAPYRTFCGT